MPLLNEPWFDGDALDDIEALALLAGLICPSVESRRARTPCTELLEELLVTGGVIEAGEVPLSKRGPAGMLPNLGNSK
jgi:hypothetical protein